MCLSLEVGKLPTQTLSCTAFVVCAVGHGPPADIVEGRCSAGMSGHHPGDVDPPEGVAALRCQNAP